MSVLPIDLQVLFSKVPEHSENIARSTNAALTGQLMNNEKNRLDSNEVDAKVQNLEQYSGEFSKINPDSREGKNRKGQARKDAKGKKGEPEKEPYKPAVKEEGKGNIIDIID
jgi:hypothetical protein